MLVLAAGGSATASSALAVIIFPVEALGAFNISIFGLHGRTPRALSSDSNPSTFPTRSLRSAIREAGLVQFLAGCHKQKGGVPRPIESVQVRCKGAFCLYPIYSTEENRPRSGHRTLPNTYSTNYSHSFTCVWILTPQSTVLLEALASDIF